MFLIINYDLKILKEIFNLRCPFLEILEIWEDLKEVKLWFHGTLLKFPKITFSVNVRIRFPIL